MSRVWSYLKSSHFNGNQLRLKAPAIKAWSGYKHTGIWSKLQLTRLYFLCTKQCWNWPPSGWLWETLLRQWRTHIHYQEAPNINSQSRPPLPSLQCNCWQWHPDSHLTSCVPACKRLTQMMNYQDHLYWEVSQHLLWRRPSHFEAWTMFVCIWKLCIIGTVL